MYKLYFKQALAMLKENKLLSLISILGTALAICMIMVMVITYEVRVNNYSPEDNRDRTMYVRWGGRDFKGSNYGNGYLSLKTIRECIQTMETPEAVAIVSPWRSQLAIHSGRTGKERLPDAVYRRCVLEDIQFRLCVR